MVGLVVDDDVHARAIDEAQSVVVLPFEAEPQRVDVEGTSRCQLVHVLWSRRIEASWVRRYVRCGLPGKPGHAPGRPRVASSG